MITASVVIDAPPRVAALLALALVTPSTGFILSSLSQFGLSRPEQKSVRTYAVGSELIALAALFFVLQSTSLAHLALAIAAMIGVVLVIPLAFRGFASLVAPYAPKSEFAFLLMVAVVCAYATRLLGVYYLVGAFIVGAAAQRYRASHPDMSSEKMIDALESFGSVFIPFYFFHAGMGIESNHLTIRAVLIGLGLIALVVPIRIAVITLHRRLVIGEHFATSRRLASAMIPTLVFTLVLVEILESRFGLGKDIAGGLVLYTIINTIIPGFVLHGQPADFEDVEALPLEPVGDEERLSLRGSS
jgi:Kef-type K+ transport system membrane component KefB